MTSLETAYDHKRRGLWGAALTALELVVPAAAERLSMEVLRSELLSAAGKYDRAVATAASLLPNKRLTNAQRAVCEQVVGDVLIEAGDIDAGLAHLQRAASASEQSGELEQLFSIRLNVMHVLSDRSGPAAATAALAEIRRLATKLGQPAATSRLHLLVAQMEARRGFFDNLRKHLAIAENILRAHPHAYLQAFAENLQLGVSVLCCQFDVAKIHGPLAVESAQRCGVATIYRASLANMGNLYFALAGC